MSVWRETLQFLEPVANDNQLRSRRLFDAGNVAAGAMIFGQFVADRPFSVLLGVTGFAVWFTLFVVSVALERRSRVDDIEYRRKHRGAK